MDCTLIDPDLAAFHFGGATDVARERLEAHLQTCPRCLQSYFAVKRAVELASQNGAKRAVVLPVSAPFHCALMQPARTHMEPLLRGSNFSQLRFPIVTNVDAEVISSGDEARDALIRQITSPVRWEDSVREMIERGVNTFVEVGPGRVLSGLLRQIDRSVHSFNVEDEASLANVQAKFAQLSTEGSE